MKNCCKCLLGTIILLLMVLVVISCKNEHMTVKSMLDGREYDVIEYFENPELAAEILADINSKNLELISYLEKKYLTLPINSNKSDEWLNHYRLLTQRLLKNYRPNVLSENDPPDKHNTSWTENKGKVLTMCIREKASGQNNFHGLNVLMFVSVHEMAHIASIKYGHDEEFWFNFKCLLTEAVELGIYDPVDYSLHPEVYCSLELNHSPLFDDTIPNNPSFLY
jgi:hypothetical protein